MKTLILMRHAKAGWADPGIGDHDRALNKRGRAATPVMASWLERQGLRPGKVLCSSARRTLETAALMRESVPSLPEPEISEALYHAAPNSLRQHLRQLPAQDDSALLIGHEPGLSAYLRMLGGAKAPPHRHRAYDHFPTAAMAVLIADIGDWAKLGVDTVKFIAFVTPRELMENPGPGD